MSYSGSIEYLYGLQRHGIKFGLKNTKRLLCLFDNPQNSFKSIHIAGTNGKGSTSAMCEAILRSSGIRTGLFTSPHLMSFTERIRAAGIEIKKREVIDLTGEIRSEADKDGLNPTFFEAVTVMGFVYFKRKGVEWAVVETGLGGRLDATNVLSPAVTVITKIGLDHREFLGHTMKEIAREKAGIIKKSIPAVTCRQHKDALLEIKKKAKPLYTYGKDFRSVIKKETETGIVIDYKSGGFRIKDIRIPLPGSYQAENASLAIKASELALGGGGAGKLENAVKKGLSSLVWRGRLEAVSLKPRILIDGAHNPQAAKALSLEIKKTFLAGKRRLILIMGVMADKDIKGILKPLLPLASKIIFTKPDYGRASSPEELSGTALSLGFRSTAEADMPEAINAAKRFYRNGDIILITGSFYTIGEGLKSLSPPHKGLLTVSDPWQKGPVV
jgi:dihydrofolate synthase/folylpolyglutamate synthase